MINSTKLGLLFFVAYVEVELIMTLFATNRVLAVKFKLLPPSSDKPQISLENIINNVIITKVTN